MSTPADLGPPADWQPSEVWTALHERPYPSMVVDLPVRAQEATKLKRTRIKVLRQDEIIACQLAARKWVLKQEGIEKGDLANDPVARELLENRKVLEIIARALVSANQIGEDDIRGIKRPVYGRLFRDATDVQLLLHDDEIVAMWGQYLLVQHEKGPLYDGGLTGAEIDRWVRVLSEAGSALPLASLTSVRLAELCLCLALKVSAGSTAEASQSTTSPSTSDAEETRLPTGTSSAGGEPADSTTPGSSEIDGELGAPEAAVMVANELLVTGR